MGWGSCLGAPNENCISYAFGNLNKTIHVHIGFLNVSPFKLDLTCVLPQTSRGGMKEAPDLLLFHLSRRCHELFPTRRHCWGVVDYRRNVKTKTKQKRKKERKKKRKEEKRKRIKQRNHNYGIKEHNISYLDTNNEISLKMFIVFISFRRQFGAPEVFFPFAPACA